MKHLKKCLTFLVIREMQIKTTLKFYLTPVRMSKIKKKKKKKKKRKNAGDNRCWQGCGESGTLLSYPI
jgi:hypothetical protein